MSLNQNSTKRNFFTVSLLGAPLLLLTTCTFLQESRHNTIPKEHDWRKQFEECKAKFYVEYPDEIIRTDWHKCMEKTKGR